ncbi:hypothetical protein ACQPUY_10415 [Clostridium nigeriense]|uniref:hypothetical protein n=1 Tax=Clostridium nigeriense TaxID=1805470 RepID=UPI003D343296
MLRLLIDKLKSKKEAKINELNRIRIEEENRKRAEEELYLSISNGNLPEIAEINLLTKRGEYCHYARPVQRVVITTRTSYKTQSSGVNFRIAKGVSVGSRESYTEPIKITNSNEYEGTLYITNKRIVFLASEKGIEIPFSKLLGAQMYSDGVELFVASRSYIFKIDNIKEFSAIMSGIGEKYNI